MRYLHLDSKFRPFGVGISYEAFTFSGGEPHIKLEEKLNESDEIMITHRLGSFNDLGLVLITVDALRRAGVKRISLLIPYFPGARQDRLMTKGEPLTVKVYAEVINNLKLDKVIIVDPHSEVTPALIDNVMVIDNHEFVKKGLMHLEDFNLVSPDAGALKKVFKLASFLGNEHVLECGKVRNVMTGELSGFSVPVRDLEGKTCVVVDDICDGGGTFLGLAKKLKEHNAGELILIVSHGIFSKGIEPLKEFYTKIISTDSIRRKANDELHEIKIEEIVKWKT